MNKNLYMNKIGEKAKIAALKLPTIDINKRNSVLKQYSRYLKTNYKSILKSNEKPNKTDNENNKDEVK